MRQTRKLLKSKGWAKMAPRGTRERTQMKKECGNKCFLCPANENCFPICAKGSCKINTKGLYAAYVRARQYTSIANKHKRSSTKRSSTKRSSTKHSKKLYQSIATRAKKMLKKRGYGPNLI
jgi:hypothetical protein